MTINRTHQTALVIDVGTNPGSNVNARVARLLESVNGNNIKVDVYTLVANTGTRLVAGPPSEVNDAPEASDPSDLAGAGYKLILTATAG